MNEELQKALAEFVRATLEGFKAGKDFAATEAPEVIQQLLRWHLMRSAALAVVFVAVFAIVYRKGFLPCVAGRDEEAKKGEYRADTISFDMGIVFCVLAMAGSAGVALSAILRAAQIYMAPKVWLIEWAMAQVNPR